MKFFNTHFLDIWSNVPLNEKLSLNFGRYSIPKPRECKSMNDVILESVTSVKLALMDKTSIPKGICYY